MGLRQIGFDDRSVSGGFDQVEPEKKYRAAKGRTDYMVFRTSPFQYNVHVIDDLVQDDEGDFKTFQTPCSKTWSDDANDWVGECLYCESGYMLKERYVCLLTLVAQKKGTRLQTIDPENSTMYWDFAGVTFGKFRSLNENTDGGLLGKIISIDCEDSNWQKVTPSLCTLKKIAKLFKENKKEYDEQAELDINLPERAVQPDSVLRQKNRLSKKKRAMAKVSSSSNSNSGQVFDEDDDGLEELDELIDELEE